jgi:hypothetical protein
VLVLGIALSVVAALAPERIDPWLGLLSGLALTGVGVALLRRALPSLPWLPWLSALPGLAALFHAPRGRRLAAPQAFAELPEATVNEIEDRLLIPSERPDSWSRA